MVALWAVVAVVLGACNKSDKGLPALAVEIFNFSPNFAGVRLNAPLELTFSAPVDPNSVDPDSIRIFTTTTTTNDPDPGAPAIGEFVTNGNVVRFLPRIPQRADLSDAGLRIGFRYAVQVPAFPSLNTVRTTQGDPVEFGFSEEFTTLNQTILPAPSDITAEPNLPSLDQFFIDEGIQNGNDPCNRLDMPIVEDRDSPQVVFSDPSEGETGFGTITGIQPGLGTAFVRMDPITINFSEPIGPWRIRAQDISIRNTNLGGKTFDVFLFFRQDRTQSELQITVFDSESTFDKASVPQGRYVLSLTNFSDLSGNKLVNSANCKADGTFDLSFATISAPTVPADIQLTFEDDDSDGHINVGGLKAGSNNPNVFPDWAAPIAFLGGMATDLVAVPSGSSVTSGANWGNVAYWTGFEMRYDNGYDPDDPIDMDRPIPAAVRLRGGAAGSSTAIIAPLAGRGDGPSNSGSGTSDGSVTVTDPGDEGKVDFVLDTDETIRLFTGNSVTGPILYHYRKFNLEGGTGAAGFRPVLTAESGSRWPLLIFAEDSMVIRNAIVIVDGQNGQFGFNGANDASGVALPRTPGGAGGAGIAGGGSGGNGGAFTLGIDQTLFNGANGEVPANVLGTLDQLSEAIATLSEMATGGGGLYEVGGSPDATTGDEPVFQGGGGGGRGSEGTNGSDQGQGDSPANGHGVGGKQFGNGTDFSDPEFLATGGAGGGGGGAEDDDGFGGVGGAGEVDVTDDGGGGGGGGAGFIGLFCGGDITLGNFPTVQEPNPDDPMGPPVDVLHAENVEYATLRAVGGLGGSTYATVSDDTLGGLVPGGTPGPVGKIDEAIGEGEAGGGGAGGGVCVIAGGALSVRAVEMFAFGKVGGNDFRSVPAGGVGGGRGAVNWGGFGGGGMIYFADVDGFSIADLPPSSGGNNLAFHISPGPDRDIDEDGVPDITDPDVLRDLNQMSGAVVGSRGVWGDQAREALYGQTAVVSEFFDTLSDTTSFDGVRVLSNISRFPYTRSANPQADPPEEQPVNPMRAIRVFLDVTKAKAGLPDLDNEDPVTGDLLGGNGFTREIYLDFNEANEWQGTAQYESFNVIPAGGEELNKRFARVRIVYDLATVGTPDQLLSSFAPPNSGTLQVAPGNTRGNTDSAPAGVPAVAEVLVTFTVGAVGG